MQPSNQVNQTQHIKLEYRGWAWQFNPDQHKAREDRHLKHKKIVENDYRVTRRHSKYLKPKNWKHPALDKYLNRISELFIKPAQAKPAQPSTAERKEKQTAYNQQIWAEFLKIKQTQPIQPKQKRKLGLSLANLLQAKKSLKISDSSNHKQL